MGNEPTKTPAEVLDAILSLFDKDQYDEEFADDVYRLLEEQGYITGYRIDTQGPMRRIWHP